MSLVVNLWCFLYKCQRIVYLFGLTVHEDSCESLCTQRFCIQNKPGINWVVTKLKDGGCKRWRIYKNLERPSGGQNYARLRNWGHHSFSVDLSVPMSFWLRTVWLWVHLMCVSYFFQPEIQFTLASLGVWRTHLSKWADGEVCGKRLWESVFRCMYVLYVCVSAGLCGWVFICPDFSGCSGLPQSQCY